MKISTQFVVLVGIVALGMIGLVLGLAVLADWQDGSIIGMVSAFGTLAVGLLAAIRGQQKTAEQINQLQQQVGAGQRSNARTLDTVVEQTNGPASAERAQLARQAALQTVAELKNGGHL